VKAGRGLGGVSLDCTKGDIHCRHVWKHPGVEERRKAFNRDRPGVAGRLGKVEELRKLQPHKHLHQKDPKKKEKTP